LGLTGTTNLPVTVRKPIVRKSTASVSTQGWGAEQPVDAAAAATTQIDSK
jgi:hypothetical protein